MYVVQPPIYLNDNNRNYHRKRKIGKKYEKVFPGYNRTSHNYDLRLIIIRHAERIDQSVLGQHWYEKVFGHGPSASRQSYRHPLLPQQLPYRSNSLLYVFDPPITRSGEYQSYLKGQQLIQTGATVDYCYSSPASRSMITASAILKGMNRNHIPIRPEPYLFEPMNWNSALLMLDKINPFMSSGDWIQSGYNVDRRYHRLSNYLNVNEDENDYYYRSQQVFHSIERRHGNKSSFGHHGFAPQRRTTVLIVGHSATTEMFSTIALRRPFDINRFVEHANNLPYLHSVVLERDAINRIWYIRPVMHFQ